MNCIALALLQLSQRELAARDSIELTVPFLLNLQSCNLKFDKIVALLTSYDLPALEAQAAAMKSVIPAPARKRKAKEISKDTPRLRARASSTQSRDTPHNVVAFAGTYVLVHIIQLNPVLFIFQFLQVLELLLTQRHLSFGLALFDAELNWLCLVFEVVLFNHWLCFFFFLFFLFKCFIDALEARFHLQHTLQWRQIHLVAAIETNCVIRFECYTRGPNAVRFSGIIFIINILIQTSEKDIFKRSELKYSYRVIVIKLIIWNFEIHFEQLSLGFEADLTRRDLEHKSFE